MAERRERLEDARRFRREEVRDKLIKGGIAFGATLLLIVLVITIVTCSVLNSGGVRKSKGEFIYKLGDSETELAYSSAVRDGLVYISMNSVAELCGLTVSGDAAGDLRFHTPDGDWVSFAPDSESATVNGYRLPMSAPAEIKGTDCFIPIDFLETFLFGVEINVDRSENIVSVKRVEYSDSTPKEPRYAPVAFMLKSDRPMTPIDEDKYFAGKPLFEFKTDLAAYEEYMSPADKNAYLVLINKESPCGADYEPDNIVVIPKKWVSPNKGHVELDLNGTAVMALEAMMLEMRAEGYNDIFVTSAYRSYNYQSSLFNTYINNEMATGLSYEEAVAVVETYSAVPGYSEHHTGLCVDFIIAGMGDLTNEFAEHEVYDWLLANAWKFGFVLRYPEDKVDVTGYSYESWHWRFVGRAHALAMLQADMTLEEYTASLIGT